MERFLIFLTLALLAQKSVGSITSEIHIPSAFNKDRFVNYYKVISSNSGNSSCDNISFKNFHPPEYATLKIKRPPFNTWFCLYSADVLHNGYGPGRVLPEKVYFDTNKGLWKKKNYTLSKESSQLSLSVYDIKNLSELQPVELYNIQSVNARGYAVIDSNIPKQEKQNGVKKSLSFCLIRDEAAFCASGSMINLVDGKEVDFTPYMLKSLETVEMGYRRNQIIDSD